MKDTIRTALIGAGVIAETHIAAIQTLANVKITAVLDQSKGRAEALAKRLSAKAYTDLDNMIADDTFDAAHIMTPPPSHMAVALPLIEAGKAVLIEKPVTTSAADAELLTKAAAKSGALVAVNQNSLYNPAFLALKRAIQSGEYGVLEGLHMSYAAPLRQLDAGQVGHWMFLEPKNILLEQAVHPLAQLQHLAGDLTLKAKDSAAPISIGDGRPFYKAHEALFNGTKARASLQFEVGPAYPIWRLTARLSDGLITADMLKGHCVIEGRTRALEAMDHYLVVRDAAKNWLKSARNTLVTYALSMAGLKPRSDVFYLGMKGSIAAFYDAVKMQKPPVASLAFGTNLVKLAEEIAPGTPNETAIAKPTATATPISGTTLFLTGATGFIGRPTLQRLVDAGCKIRALIRSDSNLPDLFRHPQVELIKGDARDAERVQKAAKGCDATIHLAHGGGGANYSEIVAAMTKSLMVPFKAAEAAGHKRFVHVGSIAGLYLGDKNAVITGATLPDEKAHQRAEYARAKAEVDAVFWDALQESKMQGTVLRPGIVIGEGTGFNHSGVGMFNTEQHCLGWSDGLHALPFVLVSDVADALYKAATTTNTIEPAYNLVGDVTPSARDYIAMVGKATGRPLAYHPQSPLMITLAENMKILIKLVGGRKQSFHKLRDFKSRALFAKFDCTDAKQDLDWHPVDNLPDFKKLAIDIFKPDGS